MGVGVDANDAVYLFAVGAFGALIMSILFRWEISSRTLALEV